MPVYTIVCPDCGHEAKSFVLKGSRMPSEWTCAHCGSRNPKPDPEKRPEPHPWEKEHPCGCPCCGG